MKTKKSLLILVSLFGFLPFALFGTTNDATVAENRVAEVTKAKRFVKKDEHQADFKKRSSKRGTTKVQKSGVRNKKQTVAPVKSDFRKKNSKASKNSEVRSEKKEEKKEKPLSKAEIEALKAKIDWNTPLPLSPAVRAGTLKNGMRYYIYPKQGDCDAVSLRLLVRAGALMEADAEDGLAHFLEHMVFNGSRHFKPGELIPYFQENGMSFGGDTNAFTYYMHTCYKLDVPKNDEASLQKALTVLNDMGFEALFPQGEIDRERGVVLEEMRARKIDGVRIWEDANRFIFQNSLLSKRFVIGTEKTLKDVKTADFFRFYKKWYTPNRMSLIVTGPVETAKIVPLIEKIMMQTAGSSADDPDLGTFAPPKDGLAVRVFDDPELSNTYVALAAVQPFRTPEAVTLEQKRREWMRALIDVMLKERLETLRKTTSLADAYFHSEHSFRQYEMSECVFLCTPNDTDEAVRLCEQFVRSVTLFGFSPTELEWAKSVLKERLQTEVSKEKSASARDLANGMVNGFMMRETFFSATQEQTWFQTLMPTITAEDCHALWKSSWKDGCYLYVAGNFGSKLTEAHAKEVFLKSRKEKIAPPEPFEIITFKSPFTTHEMPKIYNYRYHDALGTETFTLGNHIRVTLKHTNFENNTILIHVGVGCGLMDFKQTPYSGLPQFLSAAFVAGGLKQGSQTALNRCFVGKNIGLDFDVDTDCYAFKTRTDRENLKTQLELIGAYLTEPGYRTEGETLFRKTLPGRYEDFAHKPYGVLLSTVEEFLSGGDTRYFFPPREVLEKRNFAEAASILEPIFEKQYMEITVVGDFDRDALMKDLFATFGQLPLREKKKVIPKDSGNSFWPKSQTKEFPFDSNIDKAIAFAVWPIQPSEDPRETAKIDVLYNILENRLVKHIREKDGNTYAPCVSSHITETFGRGCVRAYVTTSSDKLGEVGEQIVQLADDMATKGITQEELDRAVKPLISALEKNRVTNDFWVEFLKNAQARPEKLKWRPENEARYRNMKLKDIQALAKRWLGRENAICTLVKPRLEKATKTEDNEKHR